MAFEYNRFSLRMPSNGFAEHINADLILSVRRCEDESSRWNRQSESESSLDTEQQGVMVLSTSYMLYVCIYEPFAPKKKKNKRIKIQKDKLNLA